MKFLFSPFAKDVNENKFSFLFKENEFKNPRDQGVYKTYKSNNSCHKIFS